MDDLVAFLRGRLAEDEQWAREAGGEEWVVQVKPLRDTPAFKDVPARLITTAPRPTGMEGFICDLMQGLGTGETVAEHIAAKTRHAHWPRLQRSGVSWTRTSRRPPSTTLTGWRTTTIPQRVEPAQPHLMVWCGRSRCRTPSIRSTGRSGARSRA